MEPQRFKGELCEPGDFKHVKTLLASLRNHLELSPSTRKHYINLLAKIFSDLPKDLKQKYNEPTDDQLLQKIRSEWPAFDVVRTVQDEDGEGVEWGHVDCGGKVPDTIHLWYSLVSHTQFLSTLTRKSDPAFLSLSHFDLLIICTALHEWQHILTRAFFGPDIDTPELVRASKIPKPESGDAIEESIMGGVVLAHWNNGKSLPLLESVNALVLLGPNDCFDISEHDARIFIASLGSPKLAPLVAPTAKKVSKKPQNGARRARGIGLEEELRATSAGRLNTAERLGIVGLDFGSAGVSAIGAGGCIRRIGTQAAK